MVLNLPFYLGMGAILQDANRIGTYVAALSYPTPINVSIRPLGAEASKNVKYASAISTPTPPVSNGAGQGEGAQRRSSSVGGCVCIVS